MASNRNHPETSDEGRQAKRSAEKADASTADQVAENLSTETEQGFRGVEVDPTPNENYTLAGQNAGAPTPETDEATRKTAAEGQADVAKRANGVAER